jgi:putative N6-adenine-specific DNA methylase
MCGSGTFLAEAGMMAARIPPGAFRKHFGFYTWKDFDRPLWDKIKAESISRRRPLPALIQGSDADPNAVETAKSNLTRAGLHKEIGLKRAVFESTASKLAEGEKGFLIMNPPYGKRLADEEINSLYARIGDTLKRGYPGYRAWIFSSNLEAIKHIGLRPFVRIPLKNGPLDTRLLGFDLFPRLQET